MNLRPYILLLILLTLSLAGISTASAQSKGFAWELTKIGDYTYIPVDNIRAFYGFTAPQRREARWVIIENQKTQMKIRPHSQEMHMNGLLFILSYPVLEDGKGRLMISKTDILKILDPILRPHYIRSASAFNTVILDAGHGGHDAGARNSFMREADVNLRLAKKAKSNLEKKGFKVILTRDNDTFLTLKERVEKANKYSNAIFISIHFNSGNRDAHGIETFTIAPGGTPPSFKSSNQKSNRDPMRGNVQDSANIALATAVQGTVQRRLGALDRGVKRARYSVLCGVQHPAVLFEGGFVSHAKESRLINSDAYLDKMATLLSDAVAKYKKHACNK